MSHFEFLPPQKLDSLEYGFADSPWGRLFLVFKDQDLYGLGMSEDLTPQKELVSFFEKRLKTKLTQQDDSKAQKLAKRIGDKDLSCKIIGTAFQHQVWQALLDIPKGQTRTYSQIAESIGNPKAVRATGSAIGQNPICVIIPCHRALPKSGGIGNFYGAVISRKNFLNGKMRF